MRSNHDLIRAARTAIEQLTAKEEGKSSLPYLLERYEACCAISQRTAQTAQAEARRRAAEERAGRFECELKRLVGWDRLETGGRRLEEDEEKSTKARRARSRDQSRGK